jgi:hypothetical protein
MGFEAFSAVFSAALGSCLRFSLIDVRGRGFTARTRTATRPTGAGLLGLNGLGLDSLPDSHFPGSSRRLFLEQTGLIRRQTEVPG